MDILPRKSPVYRRERVELVLEQIRVLRVEEPVSQSACSLCRKDPTYTRINFPPSDATLVLFPTISLGHTKSSSIFS